MSAVTDGAQTQRPLRDEGVFGPELVGVFRTWPREPSGLAGSVNPPGLLILAPATAPLPPMKLFRLVGIAELGHLRGATLRREAVRARLHAHGVHDVAEVLVDRRVADLRIGPGALVDAVDLAGPVGALRQAVAVPSGSTRGRR